jgi:hypothetical protein
MPAGAGWWACDACTDYATGAGDFAEVFAVSQLGPVDFRSEIGPPPDAATLTALAPLFVQQETAAHRSGQARGSGVTARGAAAARHRPRP